MYEEEIERLQEIVVERKTIRKNVFKKLRALTREVRNQVAEKAGWSKSSSLGRKLRYASEISDEWVVKLMKAMDELKLTILVTTGS
jgi:hypothetical protein